MSEKTTARVRREELRAELSREGLRALDRHDVTQAQLAEAVGCSKQQVQEWCDHTSPKGPQVQDLALMPAPVALDLLRWVAGKFGCALVPVTDDRQVDLTTLALVATEANDVVRVMSSALADGELTPAECESIAVEAGEAARALHELEAAARKRHSETVRSLRAVSAGK